MLMLLEKEAQLQEELRLLESREKMSMGDDFVPHLHPFQGVTVFASPFGFKVRFFEHTLPWAYPVTEGDDQQEKVYYLPVPEVTD